MHEGLNDTLSARLCKHGQPCR